MRKGKSQFKDNLQLCLNVVFLTVFILRGKLVMGVIIFFALTFLTVLFQYRSFLWQFFLWKIGKGDVPVITPDLLANEHGHVSVTCPECNIAGLGEVVGKEVLFKCGVCGFGEGDVVLPIRKEEVKLSRVLSGVGIGLILIVVFVLIAIQIGQIQLDKQHKIEEQQAAKGKLKKELLKLREFRDRCWVIINNIDEFGIPVIKKFDGESDKNFDKRQSRIIMDWAIFTGEFEIKKGEPNLERSKRFNEFFEAKRKAIVKKLEKLNKSGDE